ncbi:NAD(P)-binding protein [Xylaria intraflava]|nr:NAD(P)-binding protein [Xylaria intraflava]
MSSYVITGVARGVGWAFLTQLSSNPNNTVIGIVRNKTATEKKVAEELSGRSNITILEADVCKYADLVRAADEASAVTGGRLDYLIANAAYLQAFDAFDGIGTLAESPERLAEEFHKTMTTNVLGNIYLFKLFLPQIRNGKAKKVIALSSGMADDDFTNNFDVTISSLNAMGKAAMNTATAKYNAQYKKEGILFLNICPGVVNTGHLDAPTPEQMVNLNILWGQFTKYAPHFKGAASPEEAARDVLSVVHNASLEKGDGGQFLSHYGNKQWL